MAMSGTENAEGPKRLSLEELVGRLREIHMGLRRNLVNLHQSLDLLDSRPEFSNIECFKKDAETRAINLEAEVRQLQEELKAIKELLDLNGKRNTPVGI